MRGWLCLAGCAALAGCFDFAIQCAADGSCPRGLGCDAAGACTLTAPLEPVLGSLDASAAGAAADGAVLPGGASASAAGSGAPVAAPPACGGRSQACCADSPPCQPGLYCDAPRATCAACASFRGLGFLADQTDSRALGVSADGTLAVGSARAQFSVDEAMIWRLEAGLIERFVRSNALERGVLIRLPTAASAASGDGRVVVGYGEISVAQPDNRRVRSESVFFARRPDAAQPIFPGRALALSSDGSVFVGWSGDPSEAFRWTLAGGRQALAAQGLSASQALGISLDGAVSVGNGTLPSGDSHALRWSAAGEWLDLGVLPGGSFSTASAANADGSLVVGWGNSLSDQRAAFRWRAGVALERLPGLDTASATTATGETVVGTSGGQAFLWDSQAGGARSLAAELGPLVPAGWVLQVATGISADGQVIVGYGQSPNAPVEEAWVATLGPVCSEPGSGS